MVPIVRLGDSVTPFHPSSQPMEPLASAFVLLDRSGCEGFRNGAEIAADQTAQLRPDCRCSSRCSTTAD